MIVGALVFWVALAPADPREANPHYRQAQEAWAEDRLDDAAAALERAYEADPRPEYLFMQAEVRRIQEQCEEAIALYRRFIGQEPPAEDVAAAEGWIDHCEEKIEPPPPAPVVTIRHDPPLPAPPPPSEPRRWYTDPVGNALMWPGLAVAGVGAGLVGGAHRNRAAATDAGSDAAYLDTLGAAPEMSVAGIALVSIGGALMLAGTIRWAVVASRSRRQLARNWDVR